MEHVEQENSDGRQRPRQWTRAQKQAIVHRITGEDAESVSDVAEELGINTVQLYRWRKQLTGHGGNVVAGRKRPTRVAPPKDTTSKSEAPKSKRSKKSRRAGPRRATRSAPSRRRRKAATGRKDDAGKLRFSLLPWDALRHVLEVLEHGAAKYGDHDWREVPDGEDRYFDAAMRHLVAWRSGETHDAESGLHHLAHAACSVLFVLARERERG